MKRGDWIVCGSLLLGVLLFFAICATCGGGAYRASADEPVRWVKLADEPAPTYYLAGMASGNCVLVLHGGSSALSCGR